jgi:hypothetical protein
MSPKLFRLTTGEKMKTYSETKSARIAELEEREEKIFAQRDEYERSINKIIGNELSPSQFIQLRQLFADVERCEEGIERIQERIADLSEAI